MSSRSYRLEAEESAADGVRRIALSRVEQFREELGPAGGGDSAAAIHNARKDLKKLRALVRLVRAEIGEKTFKTENRRYRDAGRLLAESRDATVKLETLAALQSRFGADFPSRAADDWRGALARERAVAGGSAGGPEPAIAAALSAVAGELDSIPDWSLEASGWELVGPGLGTSYGQGRRAMKRALADPSAANVHEWRKRVKDLWYQLRIVQGAWPALLGETANQAHELADLLGDHHDLAMLGTDLASRPGIEAPEALGALLERRQAELLTEAVAIGRRLYAEKPKAFARRLGRYWLAWRKA